MRLLRKTTLLIAAVALIAGAAPAGGSISPGSPSDDACLELTSPSAAPVGTGACPGVRPGAKTLIPSEGVSCTLGFVYTDKAGRFYITTAGHCAADEGRRHVWAAGKGPVAQDSTGKAFGRFVFASFGGRYDIGIIAVNKGSALKASMCHFGGPTGLSSSRSSELVTIEHYGNATGIGQLLPARTGIAIGMNDPYDASTLLASYKGDSGGPVIASGTGRAIGYVTSLGLGIDTAASPLPVSGPVFVKRLGPQMALASKALKQTFKLRTAAHTASSVALP